MILVWLCDLCVLCG